MSTTPTGFDEVFATLKQVFHRHLNRLNVQSDSATEYTLVGRKPSPFPQHKGHPMFFSMQGKACFNFKITPDADLIAELERLTHAGFKSFNDKNWV
jgi:hypothetical protein